MLEYARSRLRLFCQTATRLPSVIVRTAMIARTWFHSNPWKTAHEPSERFPTAGSRNETLKKRIIMAKPRSEEATARNAVTVIGDPRSEERRVGKECRSRW